jgi:hypothetical protein
MMVILTNPVTIDANSINSMDGYKPSDNYIDAGFIPPVTNWPGEDCTIQFSANAPFTTIFAVVWEFMCVIK